MGFAGSDAFASLSFPFSLRRGPPPKFGGANDKLDRLFYDSIARRRQFGSSTGYSAFTYMLLNALFTMVDSASGLLYFTLAYMSIVILLFS